MKRRASEENIHPLSLELRVTEYSHFIRVTFLWKISIFNHQQSFMVACLYVITGSAGISCTRCSFVSASIDYSSHSYRLCRGDLDINRKHLCALAGALWPRPLCSGLPTPTSARGGTTISIYGALGFLFSCSPPTSLHNLTAMDQGFV